MPPNSGTQIYGDLVLNAAQNTARHGYGKLSVKSDLELTGPQETAQTFRTTAADLVVNGADRKSRNFIFF